MPETPQPQACCSNSLAGGTWVRASKDAIHLVEDAFCAHCERQDENEAHRLWERPRNNTLVTPVPRGFLRRAGYVSLCKLHSHKQDNACPILRFARSLNNADHPGSTQSETDGSQVLDSCRCHVCQEVKGEDTVWCSKGHRRFQQEIDANHVVENEINHRQGCVHTTHCGDLHCGAADKGASESK